MRHVITRGNLYRNELQIASRKVDVVVGIVGDAPRNNTPDRYFAEAGGRIRGRRRFKEATTRRRRDYIASSWVEPFLAGAISGCRVGCHHYATKLIRNPFIGSRRLHAYARRHGLIARENAAISCLWRTCLERLTRAAVSFFSLMDCWERDRCVEPTVTRQDISLYPALPRHVNHLCHCYRSL